MVDNPETIQNGVRGDLLEADFWGVGKAKFSIGRFTGEGASLGPEDRRKTKWPMGNLSIKLRSEGPRL
jgi:hypothetical protein